MILFRNKNEQASTKTQGRVVQSWVKITQG